LSGHILKMPFRLYFRIFRLTHNITYHQTCAVIHITNLGTEPQLFSCLAAVAHSLSPSHQQLITYFAWLPTLLRVSWTPDCYPLSHASESDKRYFCCHRKRYLATWCSSCGVCSYVIILAFSCGCGGDSHRALRSHRLTSYVVPVDDSSSVINCEGISILRKHV
jgi:hypothetical protein